MGATRDVDFGAPRIYIIKDKCQGFQLRVMHVKHRRPRNVHTIFQTGKGDAYADRIGLLWNLPRQSEAGSSASSKRYSCVRVQGVVGCESSGRARKDLNILKSLHLQDARLYSCSIFSRACLKSSV